MGVLVLGLGLMGCAPADGDGSGKTKLVLSFWGSANELATFKQLVADFEALYPDITVEARHIPQNYFQKIHILMASGLTPDVMMVNSLSLPVYSEHDQFLPLTDLLGTDAFPVERADFYAGALAALSRHGTLYAMPRDVSNLVVYVNKRMFEQAGVPLPPRNWTLDQMRQTARRMTRDVNHDGHPEQFGMSFYAKPPLFWLPFVWSEGGRLLADDLHTLAIDRPETINALQAYADLRGNEPVAPRRIDTGAVTMSQLFIQEKLAMMVNGRWMVPALRQQVGFDWDVWPFPRGRQGSVVGIDASGYAIAKQTQHKAEALKLVAFLSSRSAQARWTESGLIIPARLDVAESNLFLAPDQRPAHARVFLEVIASGMPSRTPPQWDEFSEALQLALEPVWEGRTQAHDAVAGSTAELQRILAH
ncbi:MAG: sugar ABC transporter substrate-binding protein [Cyanobacteria bacterium HKST-UBA03]|nr:sugar ABC transporter substrate-binding protein [Cyanobacteria bacterium HKST-UBA03]